ncbi:glutathione S-transferase family protein [Acuticoccus sp. I52.16.1]|uniref:glutathione S-transferase family protein n=1 Tax=Acuticoccus sp. I52.16.1 TaxID=2928472 RepID=UPI001FD30A29|nr:glutathione S-transferase family protein [Acuticoccus sp. I52.16.1]UOM33270.1 glutathione S-transferase family protein [Acuticoccus sp. I52.16.1]
MADVTLYTNPMSRGRMARWMLEEIGAPYERVVVPYGEGGTAAAQYRALNPMGKVPAIRHGDAVVTETAAICAYLADAFPAAGLAPEPAHRAAYYRWLFFAAGCLEPAVTMHALQVEISAERSRMVGFGTYARTLDALEAAVSAGPYIAGDRFTAADVYVGAQVTWGLAFGSIEPRAAFTAYSERMAAREAYRRATALDDADAKEMTAE